MADQRQFDIVAFGITGYTGKFVLQHLIREYVLGSQKDMNLKFAVAGRSRNKVVEAYNLVADKCELPKNKRIDFDSQLILADSADEASLRKMCKQTKVVITTVGPYLTYGEGLVKACVQERTNYCDITGELNFVRRMIEKYGEEAKKKGIKLVPCCGFDCIPTDMAVAYLQQESMDRWSKPCTDVNIRITKFGGGVSGGTFASLLAILNDLEGEQKRLKDAGKTERDNPEFLNGGLLGDPYFLALTTDTFKAKPTRMPGCGVDGVVYERDFGYVMPFHISEIVDTQVINWSNALRKNLYGKEFQMNEGFALKRGYLMTFFINFFVKMMLSLIIWPLTRPLMKMFLPKQGQGNDSEDGVYESIVVGKTTGSDNKNHKLKVKFFFQGDPGYFWAGRFLAECGIFIARRQDELLSQQDGGFMTPSTAIGTNLLRRLNTLGLTCGVIEEQ